MKISIVFGKVDAVIIHNACNFVYLPKSGIITMFFESHSNFLYAMMGELNKYNPQQFGQDSFEQTKVYKLIVTYKDSIQLTISD